jgi:hypothetical protein
MTLVYVAKALDMVTDLEKKDGYDFSDDTVSFLLNKIRGIHAFEPPIYNDILPSEEDWTYLEDIISIELGGYLSEHSDVDIDYEEKDKNIDFQLELFQKAVKYLEEYCLLHNA